MFRKAVGYSILLLLIFLQWPAYSQQTGNTTDTIYGYDPILYNGRQYTFQVPGNATGNPYLYENGFQKGWIIVKDKVYENLSLNIDLVNQLLLMRFINHDGALVVFEISTSWLGNFGINESEFIYEGKVIYEIIGKGNVQVRYQWKKDLTVDAMVNAKGYTFSKAKKIKELIILGKIYNYNKNKVFIKSFDPSLKANIRNYLKLNNIKVNKSNRSAIESLVNYCNTLIHP